MHTTYTPEQSARFAADEVNYVRSQLLAVWNDDTRDTVADAALCVEISERLTAALAEYRDALARLNPEP